MLEELQRKLQVLEERAEELQDEDEELESEFELYKDFFIWRQEIRKYESFTARLDDIVGHVTSFDDDIEETLTELKNNSAEMVKLKKDITELVCCDENKKKIESTKENFCESLKKLRGLASEAFAIGIYDDYDEDDEGDEVEDDR